MDQKVIDYINQQRVMGRNDEEIRDELLREGWDDYEVDEARRLADVTKAGRRPFGTESMKGSRDAVIKMVVAVLVVTSLVVATVVVHFFYWDGSVSGNVIERARLDASN